MTSENDICNSQSQDLRLTANLGRKAEAGVSYLRRGALSESSLLAVFEFDALQGSER